MGRSNKAEFDEIFERIAEIEGDIRALQMLQLHHIFECDAAHRHHADSLALSLEKDIINLRPVPPNERIRLSLQRLLERIQNIAEDNHQRLSD
jgi:hypothetical protein